jgi:elongation of very long chain fatty acids protein 6
MRPDLAGRSTSPPSCYPECDESGIYRAKSGINYTVVFFFERKFFNDEYIHMNGKWIENYWRTGFIYSAIYIALIYAGQRYMKNREKFDMRRGLIAWSVLLCLFSTAGCIRLWPEFIHSFMKHGLEHTYCSRDFIHGVSGTWSALFVISKFPELFDTFFIVARKQKLIFLHWFHHATVLVYCWYSTSDFSPSGRWFALINYNVHAVMYGYYACRAMRFSIPRWVNMTITAGQISQMVVGIFVNLSAFFKKQRGEECGVSYDNIKWSFIMYVSYFVLFSLFFLNTYIQSGSKARAAVRKEEPKSE